MATYKSLSFKIVTGCLLGIFLFHCIFRPQYFIIQKDQVLLADKSQSFKKDVIEPEVKADVTSSITTWRQAAAMIESYACRQVKYDCKNIVKIGNWHICQDEPYLIKPPCLVYSFGINFDFSFDDGMAKLGCEVHSFDPSMNVDDHMHSENVTFHAYGISHEDSASFSPNKDIYVHDEQKWKVLTLKSFIEKLGHEKRTIDVLKIDVEAYEWLVVGNIIEDGLFSRVRQYLTEWHLFLDRPEKKDYVQASHVYKQLLEAGLQEYHSSCHKKEIPFDTYRLQIDIKYVNSLFAHQP